MKRLIALLFLLPVSLHAECKVGDALVTLRPGAEWTMTNNDLSTLVWLSTQTIPTAQEIQTAQTACLDTLTPAGILTGQRNAAIAQLNTDPSGNAKVIRAVFLVELDEINLIRSLLVPAQPQRTIAQFKTAVQTKINSGAAD